jgi:hypothetical protein
MRNGAGTHRWKSWREASIDEIIGLPETFSGISRYWFL